MMMGMVGKRICVALFLGTALAAPADPQADLHLHLPVSALADLLDSPTDLLVAENNVAPWPSGHGEDPPPLGSVVRVDSTGTRQVVATGLEDPVWVAGSFDGDHAYVGLFHSGQIARVSLRNGTTETIATNLSWYRI